MLLMLLPEKHTKLFAALPVRDVGLRAAQVCFIFCCNGTDGMALVQELAKDPVKLQKVLEANPQLMTALQSKLGSKLA